MSPARILLPAIADRELDERCRRELTAAGHQVLDGRQALPEGEAPDLEIVVCAVGDVAHGPRLPGAPPFAVLVTGLRAAPVAPAVTDWLLETASHAAVAGAVALLVPPFAPGGLVAQISLAWARAVDLDAARRRQTSLLEALDKARPINVAAGILSERHGGTPAACFELMRAHARRHRQPLAGVAEAVIAREIDLPPVRPDGSASS
jgi:hypothetical protein